MARTKTDEARQIPINTTLEGMFREMRREQPVGFQSVFTYRASEDKLKGLLPVRTRLKPAPSPNVISSVKTAFVSAVKKAGIRDFRFHDLRHTFASQMVMRRASLKDVQEILGHKTMTITLRYAHLSQEHKKKAVSLLEGMTSPSGVVMSQNVTKPTFDTKKEVSLAS